MRHINLAALFYLSLIGNLHSLEIIEKYFQDIYSEERSKFIECVEREDLFDKNVINTKCELSERLQKSSYILFEKETLYKEDIFDNFERFTKTIASKKKLPKYPQRSLERDEMGYVLLNFDIDENGNTSNVEVLKGFCGNIFSPFTEFKECNSFNIYAKNYISNIKYNPTKYNGQAIYSKNNRHRITYLLEGSDSLYITKNKQDYRKLVSQINDGKLSVALDLAKENVEHHSIFIYQLGRINYLNKNFEQAEKHFRSFIKKAEDNKESIPETILNFTISLLIESMFEQGKYEDIIKMSFNINSYIKNRKDLNESIAITHLYIGISLLNVGNIEDGIFYLIKSKRNTENMNQVNFIDGILKNVSNYL